MKALSLGFMLWGSLAFGEQSAGLATPDGEALKSHVAYLCSDLCAGRQTHTAGEKAASAYIAKHWENLGLKPLQVGGFGESTPYHFPWSGGDIGWHVQVPAWDGGSLAMAWWQDALAQLNSRAYSCNVCGMQEGRDATLKGEYIVLSAHYDHLGTSKTAGIYRGADDNASGTAVVMEVARMLQSANLKRSVIYLACSGEELGRLGSMAFVNKAPMKAQFKANINLDMVGRNESDRLHVAPTATDPLVFSLTRDARTLAAKHGLPLSAALDQHLTASDQYSFIAKQVPAVVFHSGLHDDCHQTTDTPDKLDYAKMAKVAAIVADLVSETANAPQAPVSVPQSEWSTWTWGPYRSMAEDKGWGGPRE